jgi:gp32 DNA binding protein like
MSKISFNKHKSTRKSVDSLLEKINKHTGSQKKNFEFDEEKFFKYKKDGSGNAFVIMRFLPQAFEEQGSPEVLRYRHFFNNDGKWLVENCPTTPVIGKDCPICRDNARWYTESSEEYQRLGKDGAKAIGGKRKRKSEYFANVYIVKDTQNPQNEGKVKIWQFGVKVHEKIQNALKPTENDIAAGASPIDVFDLETGANFVLNIFTDKDGYSKYEKCSFQEAKPLFEDETKNESVYNGIYNLFEFIDPTTFKSNEQLEQNLAKVLGKNVQTNNETTSKQEPKKETVKEENQFAEKLPPKEEPVKEEKKSPYTEPPEESKNEDLDELFDDFFE